MKKLTVVAEGVGRNSVAILGRMRREGKRPDAVVFANVGSEKRGTYEFVPHLRQWLAENDFPGLTVVRYTPKTAPYCSIEGNMILNATLPGACFNWGSCTMKFKIDPQNQWYRHWEPAQQVWAAGEKITKFIGFDAGEEYRTSRAADKAHTSEQDKFDIQYPLQDWGMDLDACIEEIIRMGLPVPPKSACYFCPNQKEDEVELLDEEDRARIILMEIVAEPYNRKVDGLWRRPRKRDGRPGSITEYILEHELPFTPLDEICRLVVLNPECKKARSGATFNPPHKEVSLTELMEQRGHFVPEVRLQAKGEMEGIYLEDAREVPPDQEDELHSYFGDIV